MPNSEIARRTAGSEGAIRFISRYVYFDDMKWIGAILLVICSMAWGQTAPSGIEWKNCSSDAFVQAKREHKFVLLDLGTQWCHWCHVMDSTTYSDPAVIGLLRDKYIVVRADADSRPDLATRYEDYGWPATIVFNADGGEIVKRRGYLPPDEMASMLRAIIADPTPGPSVQPATVIHYGADQALSDSVRQALQQRFVDSYDTQQGAWGRDQKFMDWNLEEWALRLALRGDSSADRMARQTLDAQLNLLDPAWGGVYQYSTDDDWHHQHFEKIMQMQAENLRLYSLGYAQYHDPKYLHAAREIQRFLKTFLLAPNGGFYTSQDADLIDGVHSADYFALDDAHRRKQGIPRVDTHQYARENGWAIRGLTALYEANGDASALEQATAAAQWAIDHRALSGGGFSHDSHDASGPYLGDTLAMGQAFLELHIATADAKWLARAESAADFIQGHFVSASEPGIATSDLNSAGVFAPDRELYENVDVARWAHLLFEYSHRPADEQLAKTAMKYLATPQIALSRQVAVGGILLANDELAIAPLHVAVLAKAGDADAEALYLAALTAPTDYKLIEWIDPESPAASAYPHLSKPAAFVCTETTCSMPLTTPVAVSGRIQSKD